MAVLDDITLLRYSEDDLSSQEKREVEELLALNPDAQKKLEMLIRSSKVLESALGHLKDAKPPESIVKKIRESGAGTGAPVKKNSAFSQGSWLSIAASLVLGVGIGGLSINYLKSEPPIQIALIDEPTGQTSGDVITGDSQNLKFRGLRQGFDRLKTGPTVSMFGPAIIKVLFDGNPDGEKQVFGTRKDPKDPKDPKDRKFVVQIEKTFTAADGSECRSAVASEITAVKSPKLGIMACRKGNTPWEAATTYFNERE